MEVLQERNVNVRTWCSKRNVRMTSIVGRRKLLVTIDSEMHKKEMRSCVRCRSRNRSFWRRDGNGSIRTTAIRASNLESDDPDPGKTRRTSIWRQEWIGSIMKWSPTIVLMFGFVCNVSGIGLIDDTEPLFAEAARQMRRTGDWITPQFNGQERFDKPPLVYWMVAIALRGTGENVWFLRLPSLLLSVYLARTIQKLVEECRLLLPFMPNRCMGESSRSTTATEVRPPDNELDAPTRHAQTEQTIGGIEARTEEPEVETVVAPADDIPIRIDRENARNAACMASIAFSTNMGVTIWGSAVLSDMLLVCTYSLCLICFFRGYSCPSPVEERCRYYIQAAFFAGLAILAKGPIGVALPVMAAFLFLVVTGELMDFSIREMPWFRALGTVFAVSLPWYIAMAMRHGEHYFKTFFGYHNIERYTSGVNWHGGRPWWYSLAILVLLYLPWTPSALRGICKSQPWKRKFWQQTDRRDRLALFCTCWLVGAYGLFAFSASQLPSYYLPCAVPMAILAAIGCSQADTKFSLGTSFSALLILVLGAMLAPALLLRSTDGPTAAIGQLLSRSMVFRFGPPLVMVIALFLYFMPHKHLHNTSRIFLGNAACFLLLLFTTIGPSLHAVDYVRQAPLRHLSVMAGQIRRFGEPLAMAGPRMPSVVYYSRCPVAFFEDLQEASRIIDHGIKTTACTSALVLVDNQSLEHAASHGMEELAQEGGYTLFRRTGSTL